jgi:hypothetical protein
VRHRRNSLAVFDATGSTVVACNVANTRMRVGRQEKTSVKVVKAVENCLICVTIHINITHIVITMMQCDRNCKLYHWIRGCTSSRAGMDILEKRIIFCRESNHDSSVFATFNIGTSSKQLRAFLLIGCYHVVNVKLDAHRSVHRSINLIEKTNKMQPCCRIYFSSVS